MNSSQRNTRQKEIILEELKGVKTHPTADNLYQKVRRRLPGIGLATVYRNLEKMAKAGTIRRLDFGGSQRRYDGDIESHHHITCIKCGKVDDLSLQRVDDIERVAQENTDYKITGHGFVFFGVCPHCLGGDG